LKVQRDGTEDTVQQDGTEGTVQRNREILPLDDYLQITGLPFKMSPEMMAETAFFGVHESSFASAEQMMRKYLPTQISDSLIGCTFFFGAKQESMIYLRYPKGRDTYGDKRTGKTHNRRRSGI
jgi:hypothetical protein